MDVGTQTDIQILVGTQISGQISELLHKPPFIKSGKRAKMG
jgi:hypothetical protein